MLSFHTPCPDLPALQQPGGASGAAAMEGQLSSGAKEQGVKGLQFPLPPPRVPGQVLSSPQVGGAPARSGVPKNQNNCGTNKCTVQIQVKQRKAFALFWVLEAPM